MYILGISCYYHDAAAALIKDGTIVAAAQPNFARPHLLLGKCHMAMKHLERAKADLLIAVKADPADPETRFALSQLYRQLGDAEASAREMAEFQRLSLAQKEKTYQRAVTTPQ